MLIKNNYFIMLKMKPAHICKEFNDMSVGITSVSEGKSAPSSGAYLYRPDDDDYEGNFI